MSFTNTRFPEYPDYYWAVQHWAADNSPRTLWDIGEFAELHQKPLSELWGILGTPEQGFRLLESLGLLELLPNEESHEYHWATLDHWVDRISQILTGEYGIPILNFFDWIQEVGRQEL